MAGKALVSKWLYLHIPLLCLSYLLLLSAATAGLLFILQERRIKRHESLAVASRLPSLDALEHFIFRTILASFPLLTVGMLLGGHWAFKTRGRFWGNDPTELFSYVTWIIYAVYLALRWGSGWRGRRSTYLSLTGFAIILVTLVALLYFSPLHTLGGRP